MCPQIVEYPSRNAEVLRFLLTATYPFLLCNAEKFFNFYPPSQQRMTRVITRVECPQDTIYLILQFVLSLNEQVYCSGRQECLHFSSFLFMVNTTLFGYPSFHDIAVVHDSQVANAYSVVICYRDGSSSPTCLSGSLGVGDATIRCPADEVMRWFVKVTAEDLKGMSAM